MYSPHLRGIVLISKARTTILFQTNVWSPSIGLHEHSSNRLLASLAQPASRSNNSRAAAATKQHLAQSKLCIYRRHDARRQPRHTLPPNRTLEGMAKLTK